MSPEAKQVLIRGGYLAATFALGMLGGHAATTASAPAPSNTQAQIEVLTRRVDALQACRNTNLTLKEPLPLKVDVRYLEKQN